MKNFISPGCKVQIVGDNNDAATQRMSQVEQQIHDLDTIGLAQIARRFISQQDTGPSGKSPCNGCTLLFPAGEIGGITSMLFCLNKILQSYYSV